MRTNEEILQILLKSIKSRGFTEKDCLTATSINTSFLTDWKKGRFKSPSYDKIIKLAQHLELSLDFLFLDSKDSIFNQSPSADENEWFNIYKQTPSEGRPYLLGLVKALIQNLPQNQHISSKNQLTSTNTDEHAAAIAPNNSNIA